MENLEQQLAILKGVSLTRPWGRRRVARRIFDLCITDKRLAIINQRNTNLIILIENLFSKNRQKTDPLEGSTIDEALKKDEKNYVVNYGDLEWICLNTSLFGSSLNFKGEKVWKHIQINKEQYNLLLRVLPRIEALKGKLEINQ